MISRKNTTWATTVHDLGEYGAGLELYFTFLKSMTILFAVISAISIYPLYSNIAGDYLEARIDYSIDSVMSMAN